MDESFTIDEFCAAEKISRPFFYRLAAEGRAPRTYNLGRIRRISRAARDEWRAALEAAPPNQEAAAKRSAIGRRAVLARKDRRQAVQP